MKFPVSTVEGGKSAAAPPTTNWTPTVPTPPPPGITVPYPNFADHSNAKKTTTKVLVRGKKCLVEGSHIPKSTGDEMGCNKPIPNGKMGFKSQTQCDKCEFTSHSGKVKMEGKGVIYHTAGTKQNKANTMGKHATPSQRVVLTEK